MSTRKQPFAFLRKLRRRKRPVSVSSSQREWQSGMDTTVDESTFAVAPYELVMRPRQADGVMEVMEERRGENKENVKGRMNEDTRYDMLDDTRVDTRYDILDDMKYDTVNATYDTTGDTQDGHSSTSSPPPVFTAPIFALCDRDELQLQLDTPVDSVDQRDVLTNPSLKDQAEADELDEAETSVEVLNAAMRASDSEESDCASMHTAATHAMDVNADDEEEDDEEENTTYDESSYITSLQVAPLALTAPATFAAALAMLPEVARDMLARDMRDERLFGGTQHTHATTDAIADSCARCRAELEYLADVSGTACVVLGERMVLEELGVPGQADGLAEACVRAREMCVLKRLWE
ncbi:uncharacterized protein V1518DRAFT_428316 [Limtongia smithiae]|uniref:uncharacterized protein n=1 Tax=Limtongia smithiae TaxID=1125753 RepID=UPI0034CF1B9D